MKLGEMKKRNVLTPIYVNLLFMIIGLATVWLSTQNWVAMLGTLVAAIHIEIILKEER